MANKLTLTEFITKANQVHSNLYTYILTDYVNSKTKVSITCPEHGEFQQTPSSHLNGAGCPMCANNVKYTTKEFISKAIKVHNNRYSYKNTKYITGDTKVIITCSVHGDFEQKAVSHLRGYGCSKCTNTYKPTTEEFIRRAKSVHGNKYNYDSTVYAGTSTKVEILCPIHGIFEQSPDNHVRGASGCPSCAPRAPVNIDTFLQRAIDVHRNKYDYSCVDFISTKHKVTIICKKHGTFQQQAEAHTKGQGCPKCAKYGFDKTRPAILYYLKIQRTGMNPLFKIGITNRTVEDRFSAEELNKIEVLQIIHYTIGVLAYNFEQQILKEFIDDKYTGADVLTTGNTEIFDKDIFCKQRNS